MRLFNQVKIVILLVVLSSCSKTKVIEEKDVVIIPRPAEMTILKGVFEFTQNTKFVVSNASQKEISAFFIEKFQKSSGLQLDVVEEAPNSNYLQFVIDQNLSDEAYELVVNSNRIVIKAKSKAGFLYGMESVRQLLHKHRQWHSFPCAPQPSVLLSEYLLASNSL